MRVLVTGHHGYIGSVTVPALLRAGHEVVGLDSFYYEGCDFVEAVPPVAERRLDVRRVRSSDLQGFDAVVHLAALSNDPLGALNPTLTEEINFRAAAALAAGARSAGVSRFLFASSCSMYGAADVSRPVDEQAPLAPLTEYARSKVRTEEALRDLADESFTPVFMRNATAYGVSPRLRVDIVVNNLTGWACTTGQVRILSDGTPWRPLVHVQDIAAATVALLDAPRELVHCEAFNVGGRDENYQIADVADIVRAAVGSCEIELAGNGDPDNRSYRVDFRKLAEALPQLSLRWSVERGATELAEAYRAANLTLEEFQGRRYTRLKQLQHLLDTGELSPELHWQ